MPRTGLENSFFDGIREFCFENNVSCQLFQCFERDAQWFPSISLVFFTKVFTAGRYDAASFSSNLPRMHRDPNINEIFERNVLSSAFLAFHGAKWTRQFGQSRLNSCSECSGFGPVWMFLVSCENNQKELRHVLLHRSSQKKKNPCFLTRSAENVDVHCKKGRFTNL